MMNDGEWWLMIVNDVYEYPHVSCYSLLLKIAIDTESFPINHMFDLSIVL